VVRRTVVASVVAGFAAALSLGVVGVGSAVAAEPYDIRVQAGDGGVNALQGRTLTAYKLADYVDGSFVNIGDELLDGVAVESLPAVKTHLERVLAKTTGVSDVKSLPGWGDVADPVGWMGGFRQASGSDQTAGEFGLGWNDSGPQQQGTDSPERAYVGTVREFADNLVKDADALAAVKAGPRSAHTSWSGSGNEIRIQLTAAQGTGVYLVLDEAGQSVWTGGNTQGDTGNPNTESDITYTTGVSQPMIVPTKANAQDMSSINQPTNDGTSLKTVGPLGVIVLKNVWDEEVLPAPESPCPSTMDDDPNDPRDPESDTPGTYPNCAAQPKFLDTSKNPGKDASDHASDIGDTIPYVVNYRVADLSAYKAALDNNDPWIYAYRLIDETTPGLKLQSTAPTITVGGTWDKATGTMKNTPQAYQTIPLTKVDTLPGSGSASATGQTGMPDAWYYIEHDASTDASRMVVGIGKWLVKNFGDIKANDKTVTKYGWNLVMRYTAQVTSQAVRHGNTVSNSNHVEYSNKPNQVTDSGRASTPTVTVKQWLYDIDLSKRSKGNHEGLEGVEFTLEAKGDIDKNGVNDNEILEWIMMDGVLGDYRLAMPGETGDTTVLTGADGLLRFRGVDLGSYELVETRTPGENDPSVVNDTPNDDHGTVKAPIDWSPDAHYGDADPVHYQKLKEPELITLTASFTDDKTNYRTPDYQTAARMTISKSNHLFAAGPVKITALFNFRADSGTIGATHPGLSISATSALWSGQAPDGSWYADDKTSWVPADLTLWNEPVNTMLAKTGVWGVGLLVMLGVGAGGVGVVLLVRTRRARALIEHAA
jgi:hypothetical protein